MKAITFLTTLFVLCFNITIAQKLEFKNSIMSQEGIKLFSYKSNGEIIYFNPRNSNGEIEIKFIVTDLKGQPYKIDTLNLDSLRIKLLMIKQGVGINESWMYKAAYMYHSNGKVKNSTQYTNSGKTGTFSSFDNTGKPIEQGKYINNTVKDGEWVKFGENGKIVKKEYFENGVRVESTQ